MAECRLALLSDDPLDQAEGPAEVSPATAATPPKAPRRRLRPAAESGSWHNCRAPIPPFGNLVLHRRRRGPPTRRTHGDRQRADWRWRDGVGNSDSPPGRELSISGRPRIAARRGAYNGPMPSPEQVRD